ncbi:MAG: hypothetical protein GX131_17205, partial [candidate division WS1 bacterium]|nr:hypothetical protein [candidate division WS1 bacterium]
MLSATTLRTLARDEITQLQQEGCDTTVLEETLQSADGVAEATAAARLSDFFEMARRLRPKSDFSYDEPSDLEAIRRA